MFNKKRVLPAALSLLLVLAFLGNAYSQSGGETVSPPSRVTEGNTRARRNRENRRAKPQTSAQNQSSSTATLEMRSIVSSVETYNYRQDANTPLKVKLAPLGQVIIEFQANDPVYKVHPSKENFVAVDRLSEDSLITDPVVLRPGDGFRVGAKGEVTPATIINLQMYSGAIIPIIVIPVNSIEENTLRVAITYDRTKIEKTRHALGLPVNLEQLQAQAVTDQRATSPQLTESSNKTVESSNTQTAFVPATKAPTTVVSSLPVSTAPAQKPVAQNTSYDGAHAPATVEASHLEKRRIESLATIDSLNAGVTNIPAAGGTPAPKKDNPPAASKDKVEALTREEMLSVVRAKSFSKYSKPLHGLSLAASRSREIDAQTRIVVFAIRNTLNESVRLVPDQPQLAVEILDNNNRPVDSREIQRLHMQTTLRDNVLGPGETGYIAVVYQSPILGTHEYLRARVAQVFAADAPVITDLVITSR